MNPIQQCMKRQHWVLEAWDDRYSKGIWLALSPAEHVEDIRSSTSAGGLDMDTATDFLLRSTLLPIVVESTLERALETLIERLSRLADYDMESKSEWALAVHAEYAYFCSEIDGSSEYGALRLRDPRLGPFTR